MGGASADLFVFLLAAVDIDCQLKHCQCFLGAIVSEYGRGVSSRR